MDVTRAPVPVRFDLRYLESSATDLIQQEGFDALVPDVDDLSEEDLRGRPRLRLMVALALASHSPHDPRVDRLARMSWRSVQRARDSEGISFAAFVQGRIAECRGDFELASHWFARSRQASGGSAPLSGSGLVEVGIKAWERSDLPAARRLGEEGVRVSRSRDNPDGVLRGKMLLAMLAIHEGNFARAEKVIGESLADLSGTEARTGLLHCVLGIIAAKRGHAGSAADAFEHAIQIAERSGDDVTLGVALAKRAELVEGRPADQRLREAWAASARLAGASPWWSRMATRVVAVTAAEAGDSETALAAVNSLLDDDVDGMERGRALLVKASIVETFGGGDAAPLYEMAHALLVDARAPYWAAVAAMALAQLPGQDPQAWRDRAIALSNGDEAFTRLIETGHQLRLYAAGTGQVLMDGETVQFLTHHAEMAIYMLALAGDEGMTPTDLAMRLWPEAPEGRHRPRLRTCLWQIRRALGDEHWRLRRDAERVYFHVADTELDRVGIEDLVASYRSDGAKR